MKPSGLGERSVAASPPEGIALLRQRSPGIDAGVDEQHRAVAGIGRASQRSSAARRRASRITARRWLVQRDIATAWRPSARRRWCRRRPRASARPLRQHPLQDLARIRRKLHLQQLVPHLLLAAAEIDDLAVRRGGLARHQRSAKRNSSCTVAATAPRPRKCRGRSDCLRAQFAAEAERAAPPARASPKIEATAQLRRASGSTANTDGSVIIADPWRRTVPPPPGDGTVAKASGGAELPAFPSPFPCRCLERGQFARKAIERRFIDLPLTERLVGLSRSGTDRARPRRSRPDLRS